MTVFDAVRRARAAERLYRDHARELEQELARVEGKLARAEEKLARIEELAYDLYEAGGHHKVGCLGDIDCAECVRHYIYIIFHEEDTN